MPDLRIIGGCNFLLPIDNGHVVCPGSQLALHVGLAAADPDLTHEDVAEGHGVGFPTDQHLAGGVACLQRLQGQLPETILGDCFRTLPGKFDGNFFTLRCRSPDWHGTSLLEDSVIAEQAVGHDGGMERPCPQEKGGQDNEAADGLGFHGKSGSVP